VRSGTPAQERVGRKGISAAGRQASRKEAPELN